MPSGLQFPPNGAVALIVVKGNVVGNHKSAYPYVKDTRLTRSCILVARALINDALPRESTDASQNQYNRA